MALTRRISTSTDFESGVKSWSKIEHVKQRLGLCSFRTFVEYGPLPARLSVSSVYYMIDVITCCKSVRERMHIVLGVVVCIIASVRYSTVLRMLHGY